MPDALDHGDTWCAGQAVATLLDAGDEGLDDDAGDDVFPLPNAAVGAVRIDALVGQAEILGYFLADAFQHFLHASNLGDDGLDSMLFQPAGGDFGRDWAEIGQQTGGDVWRAWM